MLRVRLISANARIVLLILCTLAPSYTVRAQGRPGKVCPDPARPCRAAGVEFLPHQLSFNLPRRGRNGSPRAISASFYAVILRSVPSNYSEPKCSSHISEDVRLSAQSLFPERKVFASRYDCPGEDSFIYIDDSRNEYNQDYNFMAVYAGETKAEAMKMLERVKATGRFPGANIRKMHIQLGYAYS